MRHPVTFDTKSVHLHLEALLRDPVKTFCGEIQFDPTNAFDPVISFDAVIAFDLGDPIDLHKPTAGDYQRSGDALFRSFDSRHKA